MRAIDLVVLDLAGTTVQDEGQVPDAFAHALATCGMRLTAQQIVQVRGASKREAIRALLRERGRDPDLADQVYEVFRKDLERRYARSARPVPGAEQTVEWLRGQGISVALNTGFDRETTAALLAAVGWTKSFADVVVCGDDVVEGRPSAAMIFKCMERAGVADPARVGNVGDTVLDLRAGHFAGVHFNVAVLSGAHGRDALEAEPHTHLIESIAELPSVFR